MAHGVKAPEIIVIGAGLHGSSAALHLAGAGCTVLMLDHDGGGCQSSKVNAGGLRRLLRAEPEIPLAIEALEMWRDMAALVGDSCGAQFGGQVCLAENESEMEVLEERAAAVRRLGHRHEELVDRAGLRQLVPNVAEHCVGALVCRDDGFASPFRSTFAFQQRAQALGVRFLRNTPVIDIERCGELWRVISIGGRSFEAPLIVNCAGAWGDQVAAMVGESVPISAESPMMMVTAPVPMFLDAVVISVGRKLSFKQAPNGTVVIGGGHRGSLDRDSRRSRVDFSGLKISARTVLELFPLMADVPIVRAWAGIEGLTPDRIPVLGASAVARNFYHSFGYSSHGFLLGPVTGKLLAELIVHGRPSLSLEAFRVSRFAERKAPDRSREIADA